MSAQVVFLLRPSGLSSRDSLSDARLQICLFRAWVKRPLWLLIGLSPSITPLLCIAPSIRAATATKHIKPQQLRSAVKCHRRRRPSRPHPHASPASPTSPTRDELPIKDTAATTFSLLCFPGVTTWSQRVVARVRIYSSPDSAEPHPSTQGRPGPSPSLTPSSPPPPPQRGGATLQPGLR